MHVPLRKHFPSTVFINIMAFFFFLAYTLLIEIIQIKSISLKTVKKSNEQIQDMNI